MVIRNMLFAQKKKRRKASKSPFGGEIMPMKDVLALQKEIKRQENSEWQNIKGDLEENFDEIWHKNEKK